MPHIESKVESKGIFSPQTPAFFHRLDMLPGDGKYGYGVFWVRGGNCGQIHHAKDPIDQKISLTGCINHELSHFRGKGKLPSNATLPANIRLDSHPL